MESIYLDKIRRAKKIRQSLYVESNGQQINEVDLIDIRPEYGRYFRHKSWADIFKKYIDKRHQKKLASSKEVWIFPLVLKIVRIFFGMMLHDMIYNNEEFVLDNGINTFISFKIGYLRHYDSPKYKYHINTEGKIYKIFITQPKAMIRKHQNLYISRMSVPVIITINKLARKGHKWEI